MASGGWTLILEHRGQPAEDLGAYPSEEAAKEAAHRHAVQAFRQHSLNWIGYPGDACASVGGDAQYVIRAPS
jgi:hypothetical protein